MFLNVADLSEKLQAVLIEKATAAAVRSGFTQRVSKFNGAAFVQSLVFGWSAKPEASLQELCQMAAHLGVVIKPQGLDQRFTKAGALCLKEVLEEVVTQVLDDSQSSSIALLGRFSGVYVMDSSVISLPNELAEVWKGCGEAGSSNEAGVKLSVSLDLLNGKLQGPYLSPAKQHDQKSPLAQAPLPKKGLRIADLGYFNLKGLGKMGKEEYFLSRAKSGMVLRDATEKRWDLLEFLEAQQSGRVDQ
jgi:hypothetical protein